MLRLILALALLFAPICATAKSGGPPVQPVPWTFWGSQPNMPMTAYPSAPVATGRLWSCENELGEWANVQPTSGGALVWGPLDACVNAYRAKGAYLIYTFGNVPGWANGSGTRDIPPTGTTTISAFATAVATRYRGQIQAYECWNELNATGDWWSGTNAQLVAICQAIQTAIATADPAAIMLSPSTTGTSGLSGMQTYMAAGGAAYASVLNYHSYALYQSHGAPPEQNAYVCEFYSNIAQQYGLGAAPVWADEGGWGDGTVVNTSPLQEAYAAVWALQYASCGVQRALWYQYDTTWGEQWTGSALTPGGQAFFTTQGMLNGATFTAPVARISGTNQVRNPSAAGAVAGTPGTLPTDWTSFEPDVAHGITTTIVSTGTEAGIPYLDLQVAGTATSGAQGSTQINFDTIGASLGQQWTPCVYARLVAGSNTNVVVNTEFQELDSSSSFLTSDGIFQFYPLSTTLNLDQVCFSAVTQKSDVAFVTPLVGFTYTVGQSFSITLRLGLPSMDTGSLWSATFTKAAAFQGEAIWDAAGGPTSWTAPAWCSFVTNYAGTKTAVSGALSLTGVPQFCTNQ